MKTTDDKPTWILEATNEILGKLQTNFRFAVWWGELSADNRATVIDSIEHTIATHAPAARKRKEGSK